MDNKDIKFCIFKLNDAIWNIEQAKNQKDIGPFEDPDDYFDKAIEYTNSVLKKMEYTRE